MPFTKYAIRFALEIALHGAILAGLIIVQSVLGQLARQLFEPQLLITPLPPDVGSPQCSTLSAHCSSPLGPESGDLNSSSMPMCVVILAGSFVYALIFVGISTPRNEIRQVRAILGNIIKGGFFLFSEIVREYVGRSLCVAAYSIKTLRARLEATLGFPPCVDVTIRLFLSMINRLKFITPYLFSFGLGVGVSMAYYHSRSLSTYAHATLGGLSLLASDLTDRAEALFTTITKSNSILATALFSLGLRFLVRSLVSSFTSISSHNKEARKPEPNVSRLVKMEEKQDSGILVRDKSLVESDEDTLCDIGGTGEDEFERNVSSQIQEAASILPIPTALNGFTQRRETAISNLSSATQDSIPSECPMSSRQQQADKLNSHLTWSQYTSSLSATSPEFVPRGRNTAAVADAVQDYRPPHWARAPPVSVRITAPAMNRHRIRRGARVQLTTNAETIVSHGSYSSFGNSGV